MPRAHSRRPSCMKKLPIRATSWFKCTLGNAPGKSPSDSWLRRRHHRGTTRPTNATTAEDQTMLQLQEVSLTATAVEKFLDTPPCGALHSWL